MCVLFMKIYQWDVTQIPRIDYTDTTGLERLAQCSLAFVTDLYRCVEINTKMIDVITIIGLPQRYKLNA